MESLPVKLILTLLLPLLSPAFQCPIQGQGFSNEPNPLSCRRYWKCTNGDAVLNECGEQDTFDVKYRQCRAAEVVSSCSYAPRDCYVDKGSGFDYQGTESVTESGLPCDSWDKSIYSFNQYKMSDNYCRNPNPDQYDKPWCPTGIPDQPAQTCNIPQCTGSSVYFGGESTITMSTGTGASNSTYDLEASYEEQILFYIRPVSTAPASIIFTMSSQSDDQVYFVKLFKEVITVYAWLEAGGTMAKANTWVKLDDGESHKITIRRHDQKIFLRVDDGPEHYSQLQGLTDKFMLPMKVTIGEDFKGCIGSFDIVTKNAAGDFRHYEPFDKLTGKKDDEQMVVETATEGGADFDLSSGCMLSPTFSEVMPTIVNPVTAAPVVPPTNSSDAVVNAVSGSKDLIIIIVCVVAAALLILLIVLVIVCRSRNKDKGVYKLKETKQFDWEYGNLPPANKGTLGRESEHGV